MLLEQNLTAKDIANFLQAKLIGDENVIVSGINEINRVQAGDIVFVDHPKYYDKCLNSVATVIIINSEVACPDGKALLIVNNPFEAYNALVAKHRTQVYSSTTIHETATIGNNTKIYPNAVIGAHVSIGNNCIIYPNVTVYDRTIIGDNVIIHANTTIGSDAFYYNGKKDRPIWYAKMNNCGHVLIENNVEIGSGCCIDKGVSSATTIGAGTKMDNMCHVGHDVIIGKNCLFAANVVIGGCTIIEDGVTAWGGVIINKTLVVGANAVLLGRTGVDASIEGNKTYWGTPAVDSRKAKQQLIWIKRIPEIWEKIKNI